MRRYGLAVLMALAGALPVQAADTETLRPDTIQARVAACTACHGVQGKAGADGYYPRLAGKPQAYLYQQLLSFRDGARVYRPMAHLLSGLPDDYLLEMATYFSQQHAPYPKPAQVQASAATLARGRTLAESGDAALGLPACTACHGAKLSGLAPAIPGLLGLPRDYIGSQLGSWHSGLRRGHAPDCMAEVANKLTPEDVAALAIWLSAQPVIEPYLPDPVGDSTLAATCGAQQGARGASQ